MINIINSSIVESSFDSLRQIKRSFPWSLTIDMINIVCSTWWVMSHFPPLTYSWISWNFYARKLVRIEKSYPLGRSLLWWWPDEWLACPDVDGWWRPPAWPGGTWWPGGPCWGGTEGRAGGRWVLLNNSRSVKRIIKFIKSSRSIAKLFIGSKIYMVDTFECNSWLWVHTH